MVANANGGIISDPVFIQMREVKLEFCDGVNVYTGSNGKPILYKSHDFAIDGDFLKKRHPRLYLHADDYRQVSERVQSLYHGELVKWLSDSNRSARKIVETIIVYMREIITDNRCGKLDLPIDLLDNFISYCIEDPRTIDLLLDLSRKDFATTAHSLSVTAFSIDLGLYVGFDELKAKKFGLGAMLHDVGKAAISDEILNAPRSLSLDEMETIKTHVLLGDAMLEDCDQDGFIDVRLTLRQHHERLDGSGYPFGIGDGEITHFARMLGVIDTYDALTNFRPYREKPYRPVDALLIMGNDVRSGKLCRDAYGALIKRLGPDGKPKQRVASRC